MLFSEHFNITRTSKDDWFDPIMETDTKLFVDPFLIFADRQAHWRKAHARIIAQFDEIFVLLAKAGGQEASPFRVKAVAQLRFPEPKEFCIGYTAEGVEGLGGGKGLAEQIACAMEDAIQRGMKSLPHFEVLGVFNEKIGPDRISDLTCTALKKELVDYTVKIATRHNLPTKEVTIKHVGLDSKVPGRQMKAALPVNPYSGRAVLLIPERFLRQLPTLNPDDWWEYAQSKAALNVTVVEHVDKAFIIREARVHQKAVFNWTTEMESSTPDPYDLGRDSDLLWKWEPLSAAYVLANPLALQPAKTKAQFFDVIEEVCEAFRHFIEDDGGWEHIWNEDGAEKKEPAAQNLFRGIAKNYCSSNNISIDREVRLGRGPVDFKFSIGTEFTAHLEVKKLHNGRFWDGLYVQLPLYMKSDEVRDGWLMGIQYRSGGISKKRAVNLPVEVKKAATTLNLALRYSLIDGQRKPSASKAPGKSKPN
jgi:hypothetical protein